jgi:hypothetical protein
MGGPVLACMLGLRTHGFLAILAEKGTHGTSPTDVAKSLIEAGIRLAIKEEWLDKDDLQKVQRPK